MRQLWILMIVALGLAWIHEHAYLGNPSRSLAKQKISVIFIIMTAVLGEYLGLRTNYNDTYTYIGVYERTRPFPEFWSSFNGSLSADPGFNLCNGIMKTIGISTQSWLMIYALVTIGLYLHFIRKHKNYLMQNIYLFFCVGVYTFAGAAIKQSIATAICVCGLDFALRKKWIRYCLVVFIGMTFHAYAAVFLLVPFLMFKPWSKKTIALIIGTIIIAFSLHGLFGTIVDITSGIGEGYDVASFSGEGVNIFRVLVCNAPALLAVVFHKEIFGKTDKNENLFFNMSMVNGCIMFIGLFGTANYFARLANFFVIAQALTLPWMIEKMSGRNRKLIKSAMLIGYLGYFYYSMNVVYGAFSMGHITVWQYLQQLF